MAYNTIYEKLTADPDDLVGALAYIIYKQQKVEFFKSNGGSPSAQAIQEFHAIALLDSSIAAYRSQATAMAQEFLNLGLDDLAQRTEAETRQTVLHRYMETIHTGIQAQLVTLTSSVDSKRTFWGWVRDVTGNLIVNIMTILVVGALFLGYRLISDFQSHTEGRVGISSPAKPTGELEKSTDSSQGK